MIGREWENLARQVICPGLEEAAAELNRRGDAFAEVSLRPIADGCLMRVGRRQTLSPLLWPEGSFVVEDEPGSPTIRIKEADMRVELGQPVVRARPPGTEVTVSSIKQMALAFAERLLLAEGDRNFGPTGTGVAC